jgi:methyltransferase (TIGR00027 family)
VQEGRASRTAVLVCQGRAAAEGRLALGRFTDPVAARLLTDDERVPVTQVRTGAPPQGWAQRVALASVQASAEVIVPRTVVIDDAVREHPTPQVVILGAGLDSRAWRMPELVGVDVFEVDHPASQEDKQRRVAGLTAMAGSVRFVPVDFTRVDGTRAGLSQHSPLDDALVRAGHRSDVPTTWVWEGVIAYLRRVEVVTALRAVSVLSAQGSRLIANYQSPSAMARIGRLAARLLAGGRSALAGEPWRSSWKPYQMETAMRRYGFDLVRDEDLHTVARRLDLPVDRTRSLRSGRVAIADRT